MGSLNSLCSYLSSNQSISSSSFNEELNFLVFGNWCIKILVRISLRGSWSLLAGASTDDHGLNRVSYSWLQIDDTLSCTQQFSSWHCSVRKNFPLETRLLIGNEGETQMKVFWEFCLLFILAAVNITWIMVG